MAIQMRRGLKKDFDPGKMLQGEWAVAIDSDTNNQIVWMCFAPGIVKRMGTYEDFKTQIAEATEAIKEEYLAEFQVLLDIIEPLAAQTKENADIVVQIYDDTVNTYLPQMQEYVQITTENAQNSTSNAELAQSYAVGTGGTVRENDDADNAKFYYEKTKDIANIDIATIEHAGIVKASSDVGVEFDGTMTVQTDFTEQETLAELQSGETRKKFFGKIAKAVNVLISHISAIATASAVGHVRLSDSSAITEVGTYALDAVEKNASVNGTMANQIVKNQEDIIEINQSLVKIHLQTISMSLTANVTSSKLLEVPEGNVLCQIPVLIRVSAARNVSTPTITSNTLYVQSPTTQSVVFDVATLYSIS